jgi:hypothetical protein
LFYQLHCSLPVRLAQVVFMFEFAEQLVVALIVSLIGLAVYPTNANCFINCLVKMNGRNTALLFIRQAFFLLCGFS